MMRDGTGSIIAGSLVIVLAVVLWAYHGLALATLSLGTSKNWADMVRDGVVTVDPVKGEAGNSSGV